MIILVIILFGILFIALYPVVRDAIRRRHVIMPAYTEGLAYLLEGKRNEAIEKFKQAVMRDSNNIDAYLRLGDLYFEKGEIERAIQIHEALSLRRTLDKNQGKKIYQSLGQDYLKSERLAKAVSIFEELIQIDDKDLKNYETLLMLYEKTDRWEESEKLLKRLTKVQKDKSRISYYYAELGKAISAKNPARGNEYYKVALRLDRNCVPALLYQGDYFYSHGEIKNAIDNWKTLLENSPQYNFLVRERIETAYYDLGKYEEVIDVYEKLINKIPGDPTLYTALARIYEKKEDTKSAISVLAKAPVSDSTGLLAQLNHIALQLKDGAVKKAEAILAQLIERVQSSAQHFRCNSCGYESKQFSWQCPKCHAWENFKKY
jgi:lipopolysaccharide biosynthesis regulator YciM